MELREPLERLAAAENAARLEALTGELARRGLPYEMQEGEETAVQNDSPFFFRAPAAPRAVQVRNVIVRVGPEAPHIVLGAHYDTQEGSSGANDNAAAVCILLALAEELRARDIAAEFVFFDGEETGMTGSRYYVRTMDPRNITGMINLDICGYGDAIVVRRKKKDRALAALFDKKRLRRFSGREVNYLPPSDDASFAAAHVGTASVAVMPSWDAAFLPALDPYTSFSLGIPPELRQQLSQLEIMSTLHEGTRDKPECVQESAMRLAHDFVLEALTAPAETGLLARLRAKGKERAQ